MCYGGCDCQRCNPEDEPVVEKSAWTTERPTRAGWYWFRRTDLPHENIGILQVVTIKGKRGLRVWDEIDGTWESITQYRGEWQGPLEPEA